MRENNDRPFAKSRRDELRIILNDQSIDLLAINWKVFGTSLEIFRTSSEIVGHHSGIIGPLRKIFKAGPNETESCREFK